MKPSITQVLVVFDPLGVYGYPTVTAITENRKFRFSSGLCYTIALFYFPQRKFRLFMIADMNLHAVISLVTVLGEVIYTPA